MLARTGYGRNGRTRGALPGAVTLAACILMLALYGLALPHEALHLCAHDHGVHGCAEHPEDREDSREDSHDTQCGFCELLYSASLGITSSAPVLVQTPVTTFPQYGSVYQTHTMPRPPGRAPPVG